MPMQEKISSSHGTNGAYFYNGVDRINNSIGYVIENCVPCCRQCNRSKDILNQKEFYEWIMRLFNNLKNNNLISI